MNATNFVKTFIEITPTKKDYQEKAPDLDSFIDIFINNHKIGKKNVYIFRSIPVHFPAAY